MTTVFRDLPFETRAAESERVKQKYRGRIPIIVECRKPLAIDKVKYLVPGDLTVGQFCYVIRKRMTLAPEHALFIFAGRHIPLTSQSLAELYEREKNRDDLTLSQESAFGF